MIRTAWVYLVGGAATLLHAGTVVLRTYFWRRNLHRTCDWAARGWARAIIRAAGVKVRFEGLENLRTDAPQIVVANHQSWFDVFALAAELPVRYRFVAKKELGEIPVFGKAWRSCGHVSVDRGNREAAIDALDQAWREVHEDRLTMILFPEGTRSPDGRLKAFKKGAFVLAVQGQVPLVPVAVTGSREIMAKGDTRIRSGEIVIRIGEPIPTRGATIRDRNRLLKEAWEAIHFLKGETEERTEGPMGGRVGTGEGSGARTRLGGKA
ncbi:MAG: lysophospholipid acyltransferase family protein [Longimicrobiales bacterium]